MTEDVTSLTPVYNDNKKTGSDYFLSEKQIFLKLLLVDKTFNFVLLPELNCQINVDIFSNDDKKKEEHVNKKNRTSQNMYELENKLLVPEF